MKLSLRSKLRAMPSLAWARLLRLNVAAHVYAHQDFSSFVVPSGHQWQQALAASRNGDRVLIATNSGGHFSFSAIDRLLAVALTLRGANVTTVLCNRALSACLPCEMSNLPNVQKFAEQGPAKLMCSYCFSPALKYLSELDLAVATIGDHLSEGDRKAAWEFAFQLPFEELSLAVWNGCPVGEHAYAGALRYFARGTIDGEPCREPIIRRYLAAAVETAIAYERLIDKLRPDVVVAHHGIYTPQGIVADVARSKGVRVVTWNPAYRRRCFIFSHTDTYHHTLMDEPTDRWSGLQLDGIQRRTITDYLRSRREGSEDWIRFHKTPKHQASDDVRSLGIDPSKPYCVAFTNVFWDAQLHYPANAFADQREWLLDTVRWFSARPNLQLIIRVHPAEVSGSPSSRQHAVEEIKSAFPTLPNNVFIVPPESAISSYALADSANAALIYATKMGVELAAVGLPVVVAGEAWVRNKGLTFDAHSKSDYISILDRLPFGSRLDADRRERALAYAYHFFFRRMIPFNFMESCDGPRRFTVAARSLQELMPGADSGLDVVCDGILNGTPFEMVSID